MPSLFRELQRRSVIKVATAYLAAAWLLIQLVGEIGPILDVPAWLPRLVLGLLAVGFPVAVVLAWIYEVTESGIRTTRQVDEDRSLRPVGGRALNYFIIGALTVALAYFVWESRFAAQTVAGEGREMRSVAVLPFADMSEAGNQEYFADGMAEEIINLLSRQAGLKVAGRTSSFSFRGSDKQLTDIAAELGVTHLLEGSVRSSGDRLRVRAQLIEADEGFEVWSQTFDRDLEDVFAVQDEIAAAVTRGLASHLGAADTPSKTATDRTDLRAYDAYLLGRYHLARRTAGPVAAPRHRGHH